MGITITATNAQYTFDMGYGGFFTLRKNIAYALNREFGENYEDLVHCHTEAEYADNDRNAEQIIKKYRLDEEYDDVLEFLYAPDVEGRISYKTCGKILNIIKDVDFGSAGFRYAAIRHDDYQEFKRFLQECYSKRRTMTWR